MTTRLTVLVPFTATNVAEIHDAIDAAFAQAAQDVPAELVAIPDPDTSSPMLLTMRQAARELGVSESTLAELRRDRGLPVVYLFPHDYSRPRIRRSDLAAWVAALPTDGAA